MNLFASSGVELPSGGSRRNAGLPRSLRVPLFNYRVVEDARKRIVFSPSEEQRRSAADYARKARSPKFKTQKETSVRETFVQDVLVATLGYRGFDPDEPYTLRREQKAGAGSADTALGTFSEQNGIAEIIAPFELKGPSTDLDAVMPGRGKSPIQQAWEYAVDIPGARWVLVSNCLEIRLHGFGRGREACEIFDLTRLDEENEHARLWQILAAERLLAGETDRLLRETDSAYRIVTGELYRSYKALRDRLITFLVDSADGPRVTALAAIEPAQKILDRILFIAFAERTDLLPDNLLKRAAATRNEFVPAPLWENFRNLFRFVDRGYPNMAIPAYNGGLFASDPIIDGLSVPDPLAADLAALGQWDYRREVPVTVLGHIFEQSITDIEALKAEATGSAPPPVGKRKKEGVVYTPDAITRFLVEQTIARTLDEKAAAIRADLGLGAELNEREREFWSAYLASLRGLAIVDPACGSGAFLVAAFDRLAEEYRRTAQRLAALGDPIAFDIFDEIVTKNLHGVDLNAESVEITRLSLWLKTARRNHRLQNLEATIQTGNSIVADPAFSGRPFDWRAGFPEVFARGGFDIVIGNPPYVRMEYLKEIKPYLEEHYEVAGDRTDLYAYFFERGVRILRPGGRLGYISSSTFFRTGSGENLRAFLGRETAIETVVDFGDLQVFEGVTTYPAILTLKRGAEPGAITYLKLSERIPDDLARSFSTEALPMPRTRLGAGSWRLEDEAPARLRDKIAAGRPTLEEVCGAPMRGIVTGLNDAFVIDRATRDRLVASDRSSAEILKPFLRGENVKRWRVESDDLWLIDTPKGKVDIDSYPAVRDWLLPFRAKLEKRATKQAWYELQQAQVAYQDRMAGPKIVWPHFQAEASFAIDRSGGFLNNKCFFIADDAGELAGFLNSRLCWFQLTALARAKRGGYIEAEAQYVGRLSLPNPEALGSSRIGDLARICTDAARARQSVVSAFHHRALDLATAGRRRPTGKLDAFWELDFPSFRAEVKKAFGADIPVKERAEWEAYLAEASGEVRRLDAEIEAAERDIDAVVYGLFDLTADEIEIIERETA